MASWDLDLSVSSEDEILAEAETLTTVTIFQQARDTIDTDINEIIEVLNNKRIKLFEEITNLENEYTRKQQQTQKEIQKLSELITHTEEALGENNLLEIQNKVIGDIRQEIEKLNLESKQEPNYNIEVKWKDTSKGVTFINDYVIEKVNKEAPSTGQGIIPLSDDLDFESADSNDEKVRIDLAGIGNYGGALVSDSGKRRKFGRDHSSGSYYGQNTRDRDIKKPRYSIRGKYGFIN